MAARGERTCAQAPRAALCVGPEMAHWSEPVQGAANGDGGHAPIQRGSVWACCHPGLP